MQALVEVSFNSNLKRVVAIIVEGIEYQQGDFRKPNASSPKWIIRSKVNVSPDDIIDVAFMGRGEPLTKSGATIKVKYKKRNVAKEKIIKVEDGTFGKRKGFLVFDEPVELS